MANQVSSIDVPLSLFAGVNYELSAPDLPEGASPANNDVAFLPGSVQTRPGLQRAFSVPISILGPVSYQKSFVTPSGVIKNLYLTLGDGILWVQDVTNSPTVATQLFQTNATYASSCTAQGREYIALSDGVHGADIPLIYDGTNLTRMTQDGPGLPPAVTSVALPSATLTTSGALPAQTIATITSSDQQTVWEGPYNGYVSFYTTFTVTLAGGSTAPSVNSQVAIAGTTNAVYNHSWNVLSVNGLTFTCNYYSTTLQTATGGTATPTTGITLQRQNNTVSGTTATAHGLKPGYLAQVQNAGTTVIGGAISSIVLNNEDTPGLATVTTSAAHGLLPNNQVTIAGVSGATVGTAITNVAFAGGYVTITTSAAHGLSIGSEVKIAAVTATAVNGEWPVAAVPSTTTFTYPFAGTVTSPAGANVVTGYSAADTGTVTYVWPLASVNPAQNYFTVQTAPTSTTFTIALSYTDGTWTGGTVSFQWDGMFFVTGVPSTTTFQYQQYGPNATTTTVGTVTPYGQMAPGIHECRVSFLFADGTISAPSPSVTFVANGGQYPSVTGILTGPSNVVGRILQFTGAGGAYFFYIAVPAQVNGVIVSTATQVNDNTSTTAFLDFSDNTLYASTAVSIPGNDLAAQTVLPPQAGMFSYAGRLMTWGGRNVVQNFTNMGFDGGLPISPNIVPPGWSPTVNPGGALVANRLGYGWQVTLGNVGAQWGQISQSAYLDANNAPILLPATQYTASCWAKTNGGPIDPGPAEVRFVLYSLAASYLHTASMPLSGLTTTGVYVTAAFDALTPSPIPPDLVLQVFVYGSSAGVLKVTLDECELFQTNQPYTDNQAKISYADNLTSFNAITGLLGATDDQSPIRNFGTRYSILYMITGTGLHQTQDNGETEPSNWSVEQVADNCGAFSIASVARNAQGIGSAGKDWLMWNGPDGAQIFTGQRPMKISQEIQTLWDVMAPAQTYRCWVKNDETQKRCYFGIPNDGLGISSMKVLTLDYRNIDGDNIAENPPIRISFTGKMIVSDLTRKWTTWFIPAWCGELLYQSTAAQPQMTFGCKSPDHGANSYTLNPAQYHDDDFGMISASYTTYFFVSHEQEQALQIGSHRHLYTLAAAYIAGVGTWSILPLMGSLGNPQNQSAAYPLALDPKFDLDFGINVEASRCAFTITAAPISPSIDSFFKLQKLIVNLSTSPWTPTRGSAFGGF